MKISRLGEAPDYRFSLANERTFLAWIRTSLGFLAGGVGFGPAGAGFRYAADSRNSGAAAVPVCRRSGDLRLYTLAEQRKAMRLKQDLPYTRTLLLISILLTLVIVVVMALVLYAG